MHRRPRQDELYALEILSERLGASGVVRALGWLYGHLAEHAGFEGSRAGSAPNLRRLSRGLRRLAP